jgi:hypothetical protein
MATNRTFQAMLNEWLNYDLLKEEFIKRDYLLQNIEKDNDWKGGTLPVPFKGACASSIKFGSLTDAADISKDVFIRGEITAMPEVWGSLKFDHRDIMEHNGRVKEQSFLKLLPDSIDDFMGYMKNVVSHSILSGGYFAKLTANGDANGVGVADVDRIERFQIGQKCQIYDNNTAAANVYVIAIDVNNSRVTFSDTRGGAAWSIVAYTTAQVAVIYYDGAQANGMTNLRNSLLSAANGGTATLYGQTKLNYPYLQAINISGATITATNIVSKLFEAWNRVRNIGKGNPTTALMSWKWLGYIMASVETAKSPYKVAPNSMEASLYGWTKVKIWGVNGVLEVVGIQEMDDDVIMILDFRALKFHTNQYFQKRTAPDGKQYYEVRETTGYYYITDVGLFGDFVLSRPSYCGILHSIP